MKDKKKINLFFFKFEGFMFMNSKTYLRDEHTRITHYE